MAERWASICILVLGGHRWRWRGWGEAYSSSVQSLSRVRLFATPCTAARQASLSITSSWSLLKLIFIESVMPSNHLILCRPLLLLPSILPSIRVFSSESVLCIRWPKYWSFSFSISDYSGLISFRMDWLDLPAVKYWVSGIYFWFRNYLKIHVTSGVCININIHSMFTKSVQNQFLVR